MSENRKVLSYSALLVIAFITIVIAFVGFSLILNYNEFFYVSDPVISGIFSIITEFGDILVYMIIMPSIYFVYNKKFGKRIAYSLLFMVIVTDVFKNIFKDPRPPTTDWVSYGFPSAHTTSATAFYGYIGYGLKDKIRNNIIPIVMSLVIILIALSRIILGVHGLQDITGGIILGIGFLLVYIHLDPILTEKYNKLNLTQRLLIAILVPTSLFIMVTVILQVEAFAVTGGFLLGISIGSVLEEEIVKYEPSELDTKLKILNLIIGIVLILVVYLGLNELIDIVDYFIFEYLMYIILSFIIAFICPLIFTKIKSKLM